MKTSGSDWYKKIWSLDIQDQSWTEDTERQTDFLIEKLSLHAGEKILDLACGFGRHSIALARRGFSVTGIDLTAAYIDYAAAQAKKEGLSVRFIRSDIRSVEFENEFDVVLNIADGAIGYLENEKENLKIFDVISKALKRGGRHFMDIMNADYAETHFPCRLWDSGKRGLTLSQFEWDPTTKIMLYGQLDFPYGEPLKKPFIEQGNPTRLYSLCEIRKILSDRDMTVKESFSDFDGTPSSENGIQLMVLSEKDEDTTQNSR